MCAGLQVQIVFTRSADRKVFAALKAEMQETEAFVSSRSAAVSSPFVRCPVSGCPARRANLFEDIWSSIWSSCRPATAPFHWTSRASSIRCAQVHRKLWSNTFEACSDLWAQLFSSGREREGAYEQVAIAPKCVARTRLKK